MSFEGQPYPPVAPELTVKGMCSQHFPSDYCQIAVVTDAKAAIKTYLAAFGGKELSVNKDKDDRVMHAELQFANGAIIYLSDDFPDYNGLLLALVLRQSS